jgi:capsule polysaccharide export protein KpsE/RkpR
MTQMQRFAGLVVLIIGGLSASQSPAQDEVPAISDNPGLPGLIAEIESLESQLSETRDELAETEADLAEAEAALANAGAAFVPVT